MIDDRQLRLRPNLSNVDRMIRVLVAALFAYLYFAGIITGALDLLLLVLGIVFVVTAIIGFCPLYSDFKFSTRKG